VKRLLIADDDAGMRAALEARFRRRGWLVDVAVNGTEALQKFRAGLHSLVITDVRMPGRDGFELMREVQSSSARTAVILLTAYGCVPDAVEAMRNGACDYLVKPVCFEKLELAVEQVLRRAGELSKDTPAAPLPARWARGRASSRRRTAAPCCSMKSAKCRSRCSRNCCARCRSASSTAWDRTIPCTSISG
jgi:DNA-binding NtrC family response regulator